ncbi:PQQ-binding-like beta-propeller repeat protein [Planctomycetaceae bacterium SH139]
MKSLTAAITAAIALTFAPQSPAPTATAEDATWNQWRGPRRDGTWAGNLPTSLATLELAWEKPMQPSYSGPITDGKHVYTTETVDETYERVSAFNIETGELLWTAQWEGAITVPPYAMANGAWIKSTPALAEGAIVVLGTRDEVICLDQQTGEIRWKADLAERFNSRRPPFGGVSSPLIDDGTVIVMAGGATVKLSLLDGSTMWKTLADEGDENDALSSPVIHAIDSKRQLVVQTRTRLCGVDLVDGSLLWATRIEAYRNMNILTPTVVGSRVFTAAQRGQSQCFRVARAEKGWSCAEIWNQKTQAYMSSPVVDGETILMHTSSERLQALDASTGEILWTGRPMGKYQSLIRNDEVLLVLNNEGELITIEPNRDELTILDRRKVADDSWAYLGVFRGGIIVRDLNALKVYRYSVQ